MPAGIVAPSLTPVDRAMLARADFYNNRKTPSVVITA